MAAGSKIEKEIVKALGDNFESKDDEKRASRLKRLVGAVGEHIEEDAFEELSEDAQSWYNKGMKAKKAGKPIAEFPDMPEAEGDDDADDEKPAKTNGKAKAKAEKSERKVGPSAKSFLVEQRLRNPDMPVEKLVEKLEAKGHKLSEASIATIDGHCRGVIRVAQDIGWTVPAKKAKKAKDDDGDDE